MTNRHAKDISDVGRIDSVPRILEIICRTTGMGFSAIARVTETHWIACAVRDEIAFGLKAGGELQLATTICNEIRQHGRVVAIDQVSADPNFCDHPTPKMYGFESYISVPLRLSDGTLFGTLCAIDPRPAKVSRPEVIGTFNLFAELIAQHLDNLRRMDASEQALITERAATLLREQFIAVLGHDLRNPLAAISSGMDLLHLGLVSEDDLEVEGIIRRSVNRMSGLIDNVMDFARGQLGGGLPVAPEETSNLGTTLSQVVAELQTAWPATQIRTTFHLERPVHCDSARIGQMLSNLLANALTHGERSAPIMVRASSDEASFELSVSNAGRPIAPEIAGRLFQPFARGSGSSDVKGLGLGLFIASEIAKAHNGKLTVSSTVDETRFTFRMPVRPPGAVAKAE